MHPSATLAQRLAAELNAVIFPVRRDKKPGLNGWPKLTRERAGNPDFLRGFSDECPSLGVLLGPASNHLCSVDLDSDEWLDRFLAVNPGLRGSLISRGARGGNVWVRIRGEYPKLAKLFCHEAAVGEWRATGGYTVIAGIHPTGCEYRREGGPPVELQFKDIHWPDGVGLKRLARKNPLQNSPNSSAALPDCTAAPLHVCTSAPLHNKNDHPQGGRVAPREPQASKSVAESGPPRLTAAQVLAHQAAEQTARAKLKRESPGLARLYGQMVERRFEARPRERNAVIVEAVPFLYRAIAGKFVVPLLCHFYESHAPLFRDSLAQHRQEAEAMLSAVGDSFLASLSADEGALYLSLSEDQRDTYRICRDLAALPEAPAGPATFFLSSDQLSLRLGCRSIEAYRLLTKFQNLPVIELVVPGTKRAAGQPCLASTYRWLLPLP